MTNTDLQNSIISKLLLGLEKQAQFFLDKLASSDLTMSDAKDIDKEISDINRVLAELSNKTLNYTVGELENLKNQFNQNLEALKLTITDLELNTLKIEFDALTLAQIEALRGSPGINGQRGESSYDIAVRYGFLGNELDYLKSLVGKDGKEGLPGATGESIYDLAVKNGFIGSEQEYLESLKASSNIDNISLDSLLSASGIAGGLGGLVVWLKSEFDKIGLTPDESHNIIGTRFNTLKQADYKIGGSHFDVANYMLAFKSLNKYAPFYLYLERLNDFLDPKQLRDNILMYLGIVNNNFYLCPNLSINTFSIYSNFDRLYDLSTLYQGNENRIVFSEHDKIFIFENFKWLLDSVAKYTSFSVTDFSSFERFLNYSPMLSGMIATKLFLECGFIPLKSFNLKFETLDFDSCMAGKNSFFNSLDTYAIPLVKSTFSDRGFEFNSEISNEIFTTYFSKFSYLDSDKDIDYKSQFNNLYNLDSIIDVYYSTVLEINREYGVNSDFNWSFAEL